MFVAAGETDDEAVEATSVTAINVVYFDAGFPTGVGEGRACSVAWLTFSGALIQPGASSDQWFRCLREQDTSVKFAPHYLPHAWLLIPTS
jgi:hypothetical protein